MPKLLAGIMVDKVDQPAALIIAMLCINDRHPVTIAYTETTVIKIDFMLLTIIGMDKEAFMRGCRTPYSRRADMAAIAASA
ncbi:hypothetical protein DMP17_00775 [Pseudonocardia sp. TMWB2A]